MSDSRQENLDAVLEAEYEKFKQQPFSHWISYHNTLDRITEVIDIDRKEAQNVKERFKDRHLQPYSSDSYQLNRDAFERLSKLRDDVPVFEELQDELFEILVDEYKNTPAYPSINRDDLHDRIDADELAIDVNLYLLELEGVVTVSHPNNLEVSVRLSDATQKNV